MKKRIIRQLTPDPEDKCCKIRILLPELGETYVLRGHEFVVADIEPYQRKFDGAQTHLIVWELRINGVPILRGKTPQSRPRALSSVAFELVPLETARRETLSQQAYLESIELPEGALVN